MNEQQLNDKISQIESKIFVYEEMGDRVRLSELEKERAELLKMLLDKMVEQ